MARVRLKTLAADLGLGEGTVSRALNGYPDISERTRLRVQEAAERLGYTPNPTARRLAKGVSETAAYLMPSGDPLIGQPFTGQLLVGLGEELSKRGWDLQVVLIAEGDETDAVERLARSGRVGGVVLSRPHRYDARIRSLQAAKVPFVVHGRSEQHDDYAWFDVDGTKAFADAVDHLIGLGHTHIAFVGGPSTYTFVHMRLDGYKNGLEANGVPFDQNFVVFDELTDDGGQRAAGHLLDMGEQQSQRPTAILCATDTQAMGALNAIRARGLVPGKDVSVIGYDGLHWGRHTNPPLTTMVQPQADAGRRLGEMLLAIIDGGDPRDNQELRGAQLLRRKSDGPAPASGPRQNLQPKNESIGRTIS